MRATVTIALVALQQSTLPAKHVAAPGTTRSAVTEVPEARGLLCDHQVHHDSASVLPKKSECSNIRTASSLTLKLQKVIKLQLARFPRCCSLGITNSCVSRNFAFFQITSCFCMHSKQGSTPRAYCLSFAQIKCNAQLARYARIASPEVASGTASVYAEFSIILRR